MPACPSTDELMDCADEAGLTVIGAENVSFLGPMDRLFEIYDRVDAIEDSLAPSLYSKGHTIVEPAENPFNAGASNGLITEAGSGQLARKVYAIHDNTCVAGLAKLTGSISLADDTMAAGGDQARSIRTPASFCGIVGMKPTLGPVTATVAGNALVPEVRTGSESSDPHRDEAKLQAHTQAVMARHRGARLFDAGKPLRGQRNRSFQHLRACGRNIGWSAKQRNAGGRKIHKNKALPSFCGGGADVF